MIVAGKARVGIVIPEDYSRQLEAGETAQILVLVDGTESSIAAEAVNVSNAIALRESLERVLGDRPLPVEARPRVLFNPDTRSANFFIPGLMVVMCQMMATMLSANAIVREKEMGTLEQLFMTPVRRGELILGKMAPYIVLTTARVLLHRLPDVARLPGADPRLVHHAAADHACRSCWRCWAWGCGSRRKAATREAAGQMAMGTLLPSIFLSGYVFPLDSMPLARCSYCRQLHSARPG